MFSFVKCGQIVSVARHEFSAQTFRLFDTVHAVKHAIGNVSFDANTQNGVFRLVDTEFFKVAKPCGIGRISSKLKFSFQTARFQNLSDSQLRFHFSLQ